MFTPFMYTCLIATVFVAYLALTVSEERHGRRLFLGTARLWLDERIEAGGVEHRVVQVKR